MKANKRLSGPGNTNLNVVGKFQCMLETKDKFSVQDIYVVKGLSKPLLGRPAIQALGIIDKVKVSSVNASSEANNYYRGGARRTPKENFRRIGKAGLTLNEKCEFSKPSVKFLGQIVDASGCRVDPDKVKAIAEMTKPTDISGPLVPLLSSKGIAELPPRIQRFRMRLLRFDFTIEHVPGKELNIADALSRAPVDLSESNEFETETKAYVDSIVNNFPASDMRLQNIRDECVKDEICKTLMFYCKEGWPEKSSLSDSLKPYWSLQGEFTIIGNMLLKADRLGYPAVVTRRNTRTTS
ncbi:unnamed protein product [Mytilus coruscus]|uniref:Uncharacterized protein n=1 Tax=Mytilus coruscus TaxID=42192 RepID=A0A6J8CCL9_MYTCO|nr:unnamed protein product [Mytilus coruscus]